MSEAQKKTKLNVVEIIAPAGSVLTFYVRHYDPRQAKAYLLENSVEARVASQDDVEEFVRGNHKEVGLARESAPSQSRIDLEPPSGEDEDE